MQDGRIAHGPDVGSRRQRCRPAGIEPKQTLVTKVTAMYPMIAPDAVAASFELVCLFSTAVAVLVTYFLGARC